MENDFDTSHSIAQINPNIRKLCNAFLTSILSGYIETEAITPDILPELLDSEPECREDSLSYLSEISRLLIKAGDKASLTLCIHLAHRIYKIERRQKTSRFIPYLPDYARTFINQLKLKFNNNSVIILSLIDCQRSEI